MKKPPQRDWLTPPTIARELGINSSKVCELIASGELRAVNLSLRTRPRWRVSRADLNDFLQRRSNSKQTAPRRTPKRSARKEYV